MSLFASSSLKLSPLPHLLHASLPLLYRLSSVEIETFFETLGKLSQLIMSQIVPVSIRLLANGRKVGQAPVF